jgi:hypothetical protein
LGIDDFFTTVWLFGHHLLRLPSRAEAEQLQYALFWRLSRASELEANSPISPSVGRFKVNIPLIALPVPL